MAKTKKLSPEVQKADELRRIAISAASEATRIRKQSRKEFDRAKTVEEKEVVRKKYSGLRKKSKLNLDKAFSEYDNYIQDTFGISNAHIETNQKFVSTDEGFIDFLEKRSRAKSKPKVQPAKQDKPPKAVAPVKAKPAGVPKKPKAKTYTVSGRTFATLAEAKVFKALQKQKAGKPCEIKEGNRKPTHKVVSFTAKNK